MSFSVVVFLILRLHLIDVQLGSTNAGTGDTGALAVAFVVGFSERFAKDIGSRLSGE